MPTLARFLFSLVVIAGIIAAAVLRILFAAITVQLLQIIGLMLAGGVLLLWVCWKLWREIRAQSSAVSAEEAHARPATTMRQAIVQIVVADVSMSLDNVLAVAGIARDHEWVLVVGLALSVVFMGVAATMIARMLKRYPWIAYVGLVLILYVALKMILDGGAYVTLSPVVPMLTR